MSSTAMHQTDPRALLLVAGGAAFCLSCLQSLVVSGTGLALAAIFACVCGPDWRSLLKRLLLANLFVLFIWLTVPWTMPGTDILIIGPVHFSREGLLLAMGVTLKCNAILLIFLTLTADMGLLQMGCALQKLHMPVKLVFLLLFTYRYIHVIAEEWKKLQTAAALRGFVMQTSFHTYKTIGNMLGLTVINSITRSHRIYEAMLLRGFSGDFYLATELKARRRDIIFVSSCFFVLACLLCADLYVTCCHV